MDGWIMQSDICNTQQNLSMDTLALCNKLRSRGKNKMYLRLKEFAKHLTWVHKYMLHFCAYENNFLRKLNFIWKSRYSFWLAESSRYHLSHAELDKFSAALFWPSGTPSPRAKGETWATEKQWPASVQNSFLSADFSFTLGLTCLAPLFYVLSHTVNMGRFCRSLSQSVDCPLNNRALLSKGFLYINFLTPSYTKSILLSKAEDDALSSREGFISFFNHNLEAEKRFTSQPSTQSTYKTIFT